MTTLRNLNSKKIALIACSSLGLLLLGIGLQVWPSLVEWDRTLYDQARNSLTPTSKLLLQDISAFGSTVAVVGLSTLFCIVLVLTKNFFQLKRFIVTTISCGLLIYLTKQLFMRPRPAGSLAILNEGYAPAFPSGHVLIATALYFYLAMVAARRIDHPQAQLSLFGLASLIVLAISLARVSLGYHFPADCLGGLFLGLALVGISALWNEEP